MTLTHSQDIKGVASGQVCKCHWVSQPDLNQIEHLLRGLKHAVYYSFPSKLMECERYHKEWLKYFHIVNGVLCVDFWGAVGVWI